MNFFRLDVLATLTLNAAISNTNAFFAYIFAVHFFNLKWELRPLMAVSVATVGVAAVIYNGTGDQTPVSQSLDNPVKPSAPLIGDFLTLVAAVASGLYQVLYKKHAALPSGSDSLSDEQYRLVPSGDDENGDIRDIQGELAHQLPFGLHPNLLTSAMGLCTLLTLWMPIPILHYSGFELFRIPENLTTCITIAGMAFTGVLCNSGFMVSFRRCQTLLMPIPSLDPPGYLGSHNYVSG